MSKLAAAVHRFPERELEIHRLSERDSDFRSTCEDFADARAALDHWQVVGERAAGRAAEYRALVEELEAAVLAALDTRRVGNHGPR